MNWNKMDFEHLLIFHCKHGRRQSLYLSTVVLLFLYAFQGPVTVEAATVAPSDRLITRLMNGGALAGRVEVYYNGGWTTICDDGWDDFDANVVCKQMGFRSGQAWDAAYYGEGTGDIAFKNVACSGTETNLGQCAMPQGRGDFSASCSHAEDAGVQCFAGALDITPIRLRGGNSSAGRVEIYHSSSWGTVCDSDWDDADAAVVCRALGMEGGTAQSGSVYGAGSGEVWLNGSACVGTEMALTECIGNVYQAATPTGDCATHTKDAGVSCGAEIPTLRLAGSTSTSGRVEVYHDGQWGTVCDNGWGTNDAKVACRQLGLTGGVPRFFALYGQGSGPIWLTDLTCSGQEDKLTSTSCMSSFSWGDFSDICTHAQDAGVDCSQPVSGAPTDSPPGLIGAPGPVSAGIITAEGDVRLTGTPSVGALVEVYNGTWGSVCGQGWDNAEGKVVCQQAGYTDVISVGRDGAFGQGSSIANIKELNCAGDEGSLLECDKAHWTTSANCSHSDDAWVKCTAERFNAGDVQLVGSSKNPRRIRIFKNNEWDFICGGNDWTENVAKVVCTQTFGIGSFPTLYNSGAFDTGTSRLRSLTCTGEEQSVGDCVQSLTSRAVCSEYAILQCQAGTAASTQSAISIAAIIAPIAAVIVIAAIIVVAALIYKKKKGKVMAVEETKSPLPEGVLEEPAEVKVTQPRRKMPQKVDVPSLDLRNISDADDTISHHSRKSLAPLARFGEPLGRIGEPLGRIGEPLGHIGEPHSARDHREPAGHRSGDLREPQSARGTGDLLSRSRHSHLLPALAPANFGQGSLEGAGKLPPFSKGRALPPLGGKGSAAGALSGALSFTARSEGSTMSPRAAWRMETAHGVPPPAEYSGLDLDRPKKKKKKKQPGGGILKNRTALSEL